MAALHEHSAARLRALIYEGTIAVPGAFNAAVARLAERAGFPAVYVSGAGLATYRGNNQPSLWTAFLADYESRRWFASYEPRFVWDGNIEKSVWQRARIGFAPYLANYNELNTWIMFQVDHHPAKHDHLVATPLIRFFYKTYLFEVGYGSNQHIMLNAQLQF